MIERSCGSRRRSAAPVRLRRGARPQRSSTLPCFQENNQFVGHEKYEKLLRSDRLHARALRGGDPGGPAPREVRRRSSRPPCSSPRPTSGASSRRNDKASIEYVLVPAARLESQRRADRRGPEGLPRQAQGPLPDARPAQVQVPARRQGEGARQDSRRRSRDQGRVREPQGHLRGSRAGQRCAHPHPGRVRRRAPRATPPRRRRPRRSPPRRRPRAPTSRSSPTRTPKTRRGKTNGGQLPPVRPRPDGPRVRAGRIRDGAGRDPGPDQDAVRLPRHQAHRRRPRPRMRTLEEVAGAITADLAEKRPTAEAERLGTRARRRSRVRVGVRTMSCASSRRTS